MHLALLIKTRLIHRQTCLVLTLLKMNYRYNRFLAFWNWLAQLECSQFLQFQPWLDHAWSDSWSNCFRKKVWKVRHGSIQKCPGKPQVICCAPDDVWKCLRCLKPSHLTVYWFFTSSHLRKSDQEQNYKPFGKRHRERNKTFKCSSTSSFWKCDAF